MKHEDLSELLDRITETNSRYCFAARYTEACRQRRLGDEWAEDRFQSDPEED